MMQELPIGLRVGSYELVARIGSGGMGTVYAAVHVGLGKRVAIKTLRSTFAADDGLRARFMREGRAAVAVRHPNVVDVDDVGVHDGVPYLVMELLEGESLQTLLTRRQRLSPREATDIVVPVLSAMAASHRVGVVHRDLKPDNIFLARGAGGLAVPKVLDFGISKLLETQSFQLTGEKAMLGTPYYMAPEQVSSARDVDPRSDLYAIGVILYHTVSGRVPFAGSALAHVLSQILHATPVPLQEQLPGLPPAFERVVLRALAKDPAARYQDAQSFSRALLPFASERVVLTYRAELEQAADGGELVRCDDDNELASTTLSSAVRSVANHDAAGSFWLRLVPWLTAVALVLTVVLLSFWPRVGAPSETSADSAQRPQPSLPPTAVDTGSASVRTPESTSGTSARGTSTDAGAQPAPAKKVVAAPAPTSAASPAEKDRIGVRVTRQSTSPNIKSKAERTGTSSMQGQPAHAEPTLAPDTVSQSESQPSAAEPKPQPEDDIWSIRK